MLLLFCFFSFFLSISLSMFKSPSSLAACIFFLSGSLVSVMSLISSYWFSYVLFLVYVGGLLVMFIYVCLVSSNFPFNLSFSSTTFNLGLSLIFLFSISNPQLKNVVGGNVWSTGSDLMENQNLSIFLFLAILLLMMLLIVVRSSGSGNLKING